MSQPVYLYTTSTGGTFIEKNTSRAELLLMGAVGQARIHKVYLDLETEIREKVFAASGKRGVYPLIFLGDKYIGELEDIENLNEDGELKSTLA
eukprot:TRINITY_DN9514_c0_g1_i1.p1 TRINITY_DN9514_c0_g1~~TRINITY_DN9514_c0_g1_i1.p1  ORF type:complete len:109 (-),score=32.65 TRINITY_DN9514_c0_g1_i1:118-396(-)